MKRFGQAVAAMALVLAVAAPTLAQDERKDLTIFKDISNSVLSYAQFTVFDDVGIAVKNGAVTLTGRVTMPYKRDDIERRAGKVPGVKSIENRITVLPVSPFDDDLRYAIARAIYGNAGFVQYASMSNPPIHIVVEHGKVTLTGVVNSDVERMQARAIAAGFLGFSLTNNLRTDAEVRLALEQLGG